MSSIRRRMMMSIKGSEPSSGEWDYFTIITEASNRLHVEPPYIYDEDTGVDYVLPFSYSINGAAWEEYSGENLTLELHENSRVRFKATAPRVGVYDTQFNFNCDVAYGVGGTIMSLFYGDNFNGKYIMPNCLPWGCVTFGLDNTIISSQKRMLTFIEDTKMLLPATTLSQGCYTGMFHNCEYLTTGPELPATTLAESCYANMFQFCRDLRYIKMLATDISAPECLLNWVGGVASHGTFVKNSAMTSLPTGASGIPKDWTVQDA